MGIQYLELRKVVRDLISVDMGTLRVRVYREPESRVIVSSLTPRPSSLGFFRCIRCVPSPGYYIYIL